MRKIDRLHYLKEACDTLDKIDLSPLLNEIPKGSITIDQVFDYLESKLKDDYRDALDMFTAEEFSIYLNDRYNLNFRECISFRAYSTQEITKINKN